ncbi:MAG: MlaA family lipoprotein, partial [Janthinobacterium lividum]
MMNCRSYGALPLYAGAVGVLLGLGACSTVRTPSKADPFEGFNRTVFTVNDKLDQAVLKPVAKAYNATLPQGVRSSVSNFFSNIGDVYIAANDFLQGKVTAGTQDVFRVVINTVFGVGGLYDVATLAKLPKHQADFGLTLAHYGVPPGPYLMLPLLGPSTVRDASGFLVDRELDPTSYISPAWASVTLYGIRIVSARASLIGVSDLLSDAALDKYSFIRNAYLQRREYLAHDGNPPPPAYDDDNGADSGPTPGIGAAPAAGGGAGTGGASTVDNAPSAATPASAAVGGGASAGTAASDTSAASSTLAPAAPGAASAAQVPAPLSGPAGTTDPTVP